MGSIEERQKRSGGGLGLALRALRKGAREGEGSEFNVTLGLLRRSKSAQAVALGLLFLEPLGITPLLASLALGAGLVLALLPVAWAGFLGAGLAWQSSFSAPWPCWAP